MSDLKYFTKNLLLMWKETRLLVATWGKLIFDSLEAKMSVHLLSCIAKVISAKLRNSVTLNWQIGWLEIKKITAQICSHKQTLKCVVYLAVIPYTRWIWWFVNEQGSLLSQHLLHSTNLDSVIVWVKWFCGTLNCTS